MVMVLVSAMRFMTGPSWAGAEPGNKRAAMARAVAVARCISGSSRCCGWVGQRQGWKAPPVVVGCGRARAKKEVPSPPKCRQGPTNLARILERSNGPARAAGSILALPLCRLLARRDEPAGALLDIALCLHPAHGRA